MHISDVVLVVVVKIVVVVVLMTEKKLREKYSVDKVFAGNYRYIST